MHSTSKNLLKKVDNLSDKDAFITYESLLNKQDLAGSIALLNSLSRDKRLAVQEYDQLYFQKSMIMIAHLVATMEIALGVFNELLMKSAACAPLFELEDDYYEKRSIFLKKCEREIREIDKKSNGFLMLDEFEDIRKNEMFASLWTLLIFDKNMGISR